MGNMTLLRKYKFINIQNINKHKKIKVGMLGYASPTFTYINYFVLYIHILLDLSTLEHFFCFLSYF